MPITDEIRDRAERKGIRKKKSLGDRPSSLWFKNTANGREATKGASILGGGKRELHLGRGGRRWEERTKMDGKGPFPGGQHIQEKRPVSQKKGKRRDFSEFALSGITKNLGKSRREKAN